MKRLVFTCAALALLACSNVAYPQIKGLIREKAMESLRKKGEQKQQEQQQQEGVEAEGISTSKKKKKSNSNFMQQKMMGAMGFTSVKFEPFYNFSSSMSMDIEYVDSLNNADRSTYTTFFNPNDRSFAMIFEAIDKETGKKQKSTIVLDAKNWAMLILTDSEGEKNGIAMKLEPDSSVMEPANSEKPIEVPDEALNPFYRATGRTKTVSGYTCKEYEYSTPEATVSVWATNDYKLNFSDAYAYMNGLQALATAGWGYGMGMVMELVLETTDSPSRTHMLVKEITTNTSKRLSVTDYNVLGFGGK